MSICINVKPALCAYRTIYVDKNNNRTEQNKMSDLYPVTAIATAAPPATTTTTTH